MLLQTHNCDIGIVCCLVYFVVLVTTFVNISPDTSLSRFENNKIVVLFLLHQLCVTWARSYTIRDKSRNSSTFEIPSRWLNTSISEWYNPFYSAYAFLNCYSCSNSENPLHCNNFENHRWNRMLFMVIFSHLVGISNVALPLSLTVHEVFERRVSVRFGRFMELSGMLPTMHPVCLSSRSGYLWCIFVVSQPRKRHWRVGTRLGLCRLTSALTLRRLCIHGILYIGGSVMSILSQLAVSIKSIAARYGGRSLE